MMKTDTYEKAEEMSRLVSACILKIRQIADLMGNVQEDHSSEINLLKEEVESDKRILHEYYEEMKERRQCDENKALWERDEHALERNL